MKLSYKGIADAGAWEQAGIALPPYDPAACADRTKKEPHWVHFGIGNIFRIFIGGLADKLIEKGLAERGIVCVEAFDFDVVDKIYRPYDNLALAVTLHSDGRTEKKVIGSLSEAVAARPGDAGARARLNEIFTAGSLQLVSFTITEKGYALRGPDGTLLPAAAADLENGPSAPVGVMGLVTALLYERFLAGAAPLALVSMDNVSHNGEKLRRSVMEIAGRWADAGLVSRDFEEYVCDEKKVSFPCTMIDKITPRPDETVGRALASAGVEDMDIVVTSKRTYIAPFVNAEAPQYLVVEDNFPNGRPPLEEAGVYMTGRETVHLAERMKVTACLNPIHTALCTYDCLLGYTLFADGMHDPDLAELARQLGYAESLPMVKDPGILSPRAFLDEVMTERFPNPYLGDTAQRIAVDISQMIGIRFGETIRAYMEAEGSAENLTAIPLAIAGWLRYLLAVDDKGQPFLLSPDPMLPALKEILSGIRFDRPESLKGQLRDLLSNENIFGVDLFAAGLGEKIEQMLKSQLNGPGSVRNTLHKYLFPA